eukprot:4377622-Amphidinium_carterae.2
MPTTHVSLPPSLSLSPRLSTQQSTGPCTTIQERQQEKGKDGLAICLGNTKAARTRLRRSGNASGGSRLRQRKGSWQAVGTWRDGGTVTEKAGLNHCTSAVVKSENLSFEQRTTEVRLETLALTGSTGRRGAFQGTGHGSAPTKTRAGGRRGYNTLHVKRNRRHSIE